MTRALIFACLVAVALGQEGQECVTTTCDFEYAKCQNCSTIDRETKKSVPGGFCYDDNLNSPANVMPQDCKCVEEFANCIDRLASFGTCTKSSVAAQNLKEVKDQCFNPETQKFPVPEIANYQEQCTVEVIFLVDLSGSIDLKMKPGNVRNNIKLRSFVAEIMVAIEGSVGKAKFSLAYFMGTAIRNEGSNKEIPGNIKSAGGVDTMFDLTELPKIEVDGNTNILEILMNQRREPQMAKGATPTAAAFERANEQIIINGDSTVQQRLTILLTDGQPTIPLNEAAPPDLKDEYLNATKGQYATDLANAAVKELKKSTLLMSVGINLGNTEEGQAGQTLMKEWASEPKTLLAQPKVEFDQLPLLIPKILVLLCPVIVNIAVCLKRGVNELTITGRGFLQTNETECLFVDNDNDGREFKARGRFVDNKTIVCIIIPEGAPDTDEYPMLYAGNFTSYYRQNTFLNFTEAIPFLYGNLCYPDVLGYWKPFFALLLLPLAFARRSKQMPATTVTKTVAAPPAQSTPQVVEEFAEYEEVEELEVIRPATNKWKVAPTAYIGFGKARMSVDWAGVAPASAPHEGVRKKVVVKRATGPKPDNGAGGDVPLPTPGAPETAPGGEEVTETTTEPGAGEFVEEPDWVNGILDGISNSAGKMCGCCKK